jgi:nucleotide-binding universal stress UspA family protein
MVGGRRSAPPAATPAASGGLVELAILWYDAIAFTTEMEARMFKTIVLALDGSEGSARAMSFAVELAKRDGAKLVIAHAEERIVGKGGGDIHADEDQIQAEIRSRAEELSAQGVETSVEMADVMLGGPAHVIAEIADREQADLIVVGTRGHSAVPGLVLGGVTQRLLHIAHRPVLAIPPER